MLNEKLTMTIEECAEALGISRAQGYKLAKEGRLPILRLGHRMVVPKKALEDYLAVKPTVGQQGEESRRVGNG